MIGNISDIRDFRDIKGIRDINVSRIFELYSISLTKYPIGNTDETRQLRDVCCPSELQGFPYAAVHHSRFAQKAYHEQLYRCICVRLMFA